MNSKFKRIVAIFALVFVCIATVSLILYLPNQNSKFGGVAELILITSAALGLGTGIPLIVVYRGERKMEARKKLERTELDRKINQESNKK